MLPRGAKDLAISMHEGRDCLELHTFNEIH